MRKWETATALVLALGLTLAPTGWAHPSAGEGSHQSTDGHTTEDVTVVPDDPDAAYTQLTDGPGWERVVREDLAPSSSTPVAERTSLTYFGQLTDFQLSDEESPSRVEFLDADGSAASSAHRPQESLIAFIVDQAIRAMNGQTTSPHGTGAQMDMTLITGDQADNQQLNEIEWVLTLLNGGHVDPNSGVEDGMPLCGADGEAARYTGVQDYDDYAEGEHAFYDPDDPKAKYAAWPRYPGLLDQAQMRAFNAAGSVVPAFVTNGNHDTLAQGNAWATAVYEALGTGCSKVMTPLPGYTSGSFLQTSPQNAVDVPADPDRRYVDKQESKRLHEQADKFGEGHGYAFVDPAEEQASNDAATYYSLHDGKPGLEDFTPGLRLISLDTVSEGGVIERSSNGNLDDPQFQWLARELEAAEQAGDLVMVMGHHPIRSLTSEVPDEAAAQCTGVDDGHGHDVNPGCDPDPRLSTPVHRGGDLQQLLLAHPNVIAYVTGHTHEHELRPFKRADGSGGFWELNTSSLVDWPVQGRVVEIVDNNDGTLSIFSTVIDHDGPITARNPGTPAANLPPSQLAAIGRTLAYNDPGAGPGQAEGELADRNVELLLPDPRTP